MMKHSILIMVLAGLLSINANAENTSTSLNHVKSVTAISKICGQGREVSAIVIEYDTPIRNRSLSTSTFQVEGEEILKVYANNSPEASDSGHNGPYVIIELKAETDMNATPKKARVETEEERAERDRLQGGPGLKAGWSTGGNDIYPGNAVITQCQAIKTMDE